MGEVSTIGLDLTKRVFHAHSADEKGAMVLTHYRSRPKRRMPAFSGKRDNSGLQSRGLSHSVSRLLVPLSQFFVGSARAWNVGSRRCCFFLPSPSCEKFLIGLGNVLNLLPSLIESAEEQIA